MILRKIADAIQQQDWFTVVLEILIVVAGIFIGLQVDDWNSLRKDRMVQAGVVPVTWQQVVLEWQRDWANRDNYDAVMILVKEHSGAYGTGVDYAYTMVHGAQERVVHGETLPPVPAKK